MEGILDDFAPMEFSRRNLKQTGSLYRVWSDAREFKEIEANSAYEALERSEIKKPFKISRYMLNHLDILANGMLVEEAVSAQAPVVEAETQEEPQLPAESAETTQEATPQT